MIGFFFRKTLLCVDFSFVSLVFGFVSFMAEAFSQRLRFGLSTHTSEKVTLKVLDAQELG